MTRHNEFKIRSKVSTATQANYFKIELAIGLQTLGKRSFSIVLVFAGNKIIFQFFRVYSKGGIYLCSDLSFKQYNYNGCNIILSKYETRQAVSPDTMTKKYIILFSVRDFKPAQPPPLPPVKGAVPLFNPSEIQREKRDILLEVQKNSSSAQGGNPFRKTANGKG